MTTPAIEIRGLKKQLGKFQLGPIDLTVQTGSIFGLIGPNGAGKTTTIDLLLGLGREDAGEIRLFGLHHRKFEVEVKRRIGYVSPDLSYFLWKKVNRLADFIRHYYPTWDEDYFLHLLKQFGIGLYDDIRKLSFGNKTKLSIAVALAHKPDLLLLDEPTLGVDAVSKKQIYTELLNAVQDEQRTVLISSHNLTDIERFADHIAIINEGEILLQGKTDELVESFRMVDFIYDGPAETMSIEGMYPVCLQDNRYRALIDQRRDVTPRLTVQGAQVISTTPVSLEEMFVALVEE